MNNVRMDEIAPSLSVGIGIVASTWIAKIAVASGWLVLIAPLLLMFSILAGDALGARLRGQPTRPSSAAMILGGAIVLASMILAPHTDGRIAVSLPVVGMAAWTTLLMRRGDMRAPCLSN
jgi:hypothetical protein